MDAASIAVTLGGLLFVGLFLVLVIAGSEILLLFRLRATRVVPCAELVPSNRLPLTAAVFGRATSGCPVGLRAPLSGEECLWCRIVVYHLEPGGEDWSRYPVLDRAWGEPFAVADQTGMVRIAPELLQKSVYWPDQKIPMVVKTVAEETEFCPRAGCQPGSDLARLVSLGIVSPEMLTMNRGKITTEVEEYLVRPGQSMLAIGRPTVQPPGVVLLGTSQIGVDGVSALAMPDLISAIREAISDSLFVVRALLVVAALCGVAGYVKVWLDS